jgi:hypothetical protein
MSAEIISVGGQNATRPILISYNAHYMTVEFPLSAQEVANLKAGSNNTVLQLFSPFYSGGVSNIATGSILPSSFPAMRQTWYEEYLGFKTPPPGTLLGDMKWLFLSIPSMASAGVLGALIMIYYLNKIRQDLRDSKKQKEKEEKEEERDRKIDEIYKKVNS